jgi:two-component system chemotaxis sensor kinase CheA
LGTSNPVPNLLENGRFEKDFELYFVSKKVSNEILEILNEILEIENKVINAIPPEEFSQILSKISTMTQMQESDDLDLDIFDDMGYSEDDENEQDVAQVSSIVNEFTSSSSQITSAKVNLQTLEDLMNFFGEAVILKNQLNQHLKEQKDWELNSLFDNMDKLFLEIQEIIFKLKLVRVDSTFKRYRRLVRDVSKDRGKDVKFLLEGMDVEIDRKILEEINAAIIHLLRNSIYHGIESAQERKRRGKNTTGTLKLATYRRAGSVYIEISDDGRGIDYNNVRKKIVEKGLATAEEVTEFSKEKLTKFLFMPGFSTLSGSDMISGRGMGLAIVAEKIKELGGSLEMFTEEYEGTTFVLNVPFTRAILKAQLIKIAGDLFAIPIENIDQINFFKKDQVEYIKGEEFYKINSSVVPVVRLDQYLDFLTLSIKEDEDVNTRSKIAVLCKKDDDESALFIVDEILQQMEVVIKPFRSKYSDFQEILGVTITGDGSICLIIDVLNIISSMMRELKGLKLIEAEEEV